MSPDLDLTRRAFTKTRGEVTAIGTWIRIDGRFRPCMVLIRAGREKDDRLIPCVITMDRAWIWSEEIGDPSQSAPLAYQFAEILGLAVTPPTLIRLAMFINDMLDDLLTIPPYQPDTLRTVAEAVIIDHSAGRTVETEIKE